MEAVKYWSIPWKIADSAYMNADVMSVDSTRKLPSLTQHHLQSSACKQLTNTNIRAHTTIPKYPHTYILITYFLTGGDSTGGDVCCGNCDDCANGDGKDTVGSCGINVSDDSGGIAVVLLRVV